MARTVVAAAEVVEAPILTMVEAEGRGRSLVAASALKPGQDSPIFLYSAFPLLPAQPFPVAQNSVESDYCSFCFRFIPKLHSSPSPCPVCSSSFFCSLHCQSLIAALLAKEKLNAFGLREPFTPEKERSVKAYGIYPRASFFNHDCLPNACRFDSVDGSVADGNNTDKLVSKKEKELISIYNLPIIRS